jgi:serine/threonine protein kinase HipA of HipAB toxin-antitoxin module
LVLRTRTKTFAFTDGHAKNFSLFVLPGGRYWLTPLHDVLSAWPLIDAGPHSLQYKKTKLAMAVHSKTAHYKLSEIQYRHWEALAQRSGVDGAWMMASKRRTSKRQIGLAGVGRIAHIDKTAQFSLA